MTRILLTFTLFWGFAATASPADSLRLEGEAFHPSASIVWAAPVKELPATIAVYRVVPQQFSKEIISRMLEIADFKSVLMKLSADKKTMQWRAHEESGTLIRSLDIVPSTGSITYFNTKTEAPSSRSAEGVPSFEEVDKLAMDYLRQLGGDTNQISWKPLSRTDRHRSLYKKQGGDLILEDYTQRGTTYTRQIDGIRINGPGGRGGIWIEFGDNAKVARLDLSWRNLQPHQRHRTATPKEIIKFIKAGKSTLPEQDVDLAALSNATKLTITKITPYYWGELGAAEQQFVYPFAQLDVTADLGGDSKITFDLFCPIIDGKPFEETPTAQRK